MSAGSVDRPAVEAVLAQFLDPETGRDVVAMGQVREIALEGGSIAVTVGLTTYSAPLWGDARQELVDRLRQRFPASEVSVQVVEHRRPAEPLGTIGLTAESV
ncbi:MAG TPA: iron-sulfur cluster assembly protein, partial [Lacipirellulaceae bacterium]|nr:iron-sulfur cluster assembly protein [Lacipirellulaceae bacterium]